MGDVIFNKIIFNLSFRSSSNSIFTQINFSQKAKMKFFAFALLFIAMFQMTVAQDTETVESTVSPIDYAAEIVKESTTTVATELKSSTEVIDDDVKDMNATDAENGEKVGRQAPLANSASVLKGVMSLAPAVCLIPFLF